MENQSTNVNVTIRMDKELKQRAETIFADMGMNMTTAFTIFTKTVVRQGKIPFEIAADPFYSEANMRFLEKAAADMDAGKGIVHDIIEVEDENSMA